MHYKNITVLRDLYDAEIYLFGTYWCVERLVSIKENSFICVKVTENPVLEVSAYLTSMNQVKKIQVNQYNLYIQIDTKKWFG